MRSNDFSCVGYIDTVLAPEAELIDGREIETIGFELITEENLRFECQTDDRQIAFRKLEGIDPARLYRCKGHFQRIDGHHVFIVEDLNLSTSVPSGTGPRTKSVKSHFFGVCLSVDAIRQRVYLQSLSKSVSFASVIACEC